MNSTYSRIARAAGIASSPPASRQISQDNLRRWEKSACEASTICNQAAAFNRCLYKVQDNMQSQLRAIKTEPSKGKSSTKVSGAADELQFLMDFNSGITRAMAKTLEHLTDFVFVTVANTTLTRRDSYLSHLKTGIKPDTLAALRTAPLNIATLFPEEALKQAEQDIANFESKGQLQTGKKSRFHPYDAQTNGQITRSQNDQPGRMLGTEDRARKVEARPLTTLQDRPRASSHTNDNHCVTSIQERRLRHLCKLKYCTFCSYCTRAFAKERSKSRVSRLLFLSEKVQSKICERSFLCHSIVLCQTCNKCCHKFACRGQTSKFFLANLAESRGRSENSSDFEGGLNPPLSDPTKLDKVSHRHKTSRTPTSIYQYRNSPGSILRFHVQGQTYQFKALPFGLSTAPFEFTVVAKEVKLMAIHKGIRIHQYLDDWLVRARSHQICLQHTQDLVKLCQDLGWLVNLEKSELEPKQIFDFVGYQFNLRAGWIRPTPDC